MAWGYLVLAGLMEIVWAVGLKYTQGFTRPVPVAIVVFAMATSIGLLGFAMRTLPVGTAYAVWTGIGSIGTASLGVWLFNEPASAARVLSFVLIVSGMVGLKITTPG